MAGPHPDGGGGRPRAASRGTRARLALSGALVAWSLALWAAVSHAPALFFPGYRAATKAVESALAAATGLVPFAVWDLALAALLAWALVALVRALVRRRSLLPWLSWVLLACATTAALLCGWALDHYAPSLASEVGLEVAEYSTDELASATEGYLADAAGLAGEVARDGDGRLATPDFLGLARVAGAAFEPLAPSYPVFRGGSTAPVKALLLWGRPLLMSGYVGLFWAPTGEAGVPVDCAAADLPFVMCHEAAHRLGIASEGEANFAAYLACEASDDARLGYAGSYSAFCYCLNALAAQDPERARQVVADAAAGPEAEGVLLVLQDRADAAEHYEAYRSGFERVGDAVNETYLTSFGEEEGVRSYGLVVDYLIAWRKARPGS